MVPTSDCLEKRQRQEQNAEADTEAGVESRAMPCRYKNMDKLIHYANKDGRLNVFYSSPDAYTDAKNKYNTSWPLKTDDFFPYADCATCYWTGVPPYI